MKMSPAHRVAASRSISSRRNSRGSLLLTVLVSIVLLSLAAYTFTDLAISDNATSQAEADIIQARRLAESGVSYVQYLAYLRHAPQADGSVIGQQALELGGLYNNPSLFMGKIVQDDPVLELRGRFSVLAPDYVLQAPNTTIRYGLEDESGRINLNAVLLADAVSVGGSRDLLMQLPNMTEDIADAILDWIDTDDDPREFGAESDYYSGLATPYKCANRPLTSIEELLLVRGVTPGLLFGIDGNRNYLQETAEADMVGVLGVSIQNEFGDMAISGWAAYLTIYSAETNRTPDGQAKVDLANEDMEALAEELGTVAGFSEEWIVYIVALRLFGPIDSPVSVPYSPSAQDQGGQGGGGNQGAQGGGQVGGAQGQGEESESQEEGRVSLSDLDLTGTPTFTLNTVLDLIGSDVEVRIEAQNEDEDDKFVRIRTPFPEFPAAMEQYLPIVLDWTAVNTSEVIPGRININHAPGFILRGIPGAPETFADDVAAARSQFMGTLPSNVEDDIYRHETWPLYQGIVTLDEMKILMPFVCAGGAVYRAQCVGFYDGGGPSARIEAVIDGSGPAPKLLLWRNISHLGRGYDLGTLGSDAMPSDVGLNQ